VEIYYDATKEAWETMRLGVTRVRDAKMTVLKKQLEAI
jgi:hypothetical protein